MNEQRHHHVREELGAYMLGALDPAERRVIEHHVEVCASCRDELARLSGMPGLLDRLSAEEAVSDVTEIPAVVGERLAEEVAATANRLERSLSRWRVAAVAAASAALAAAVALIVLVGPTDPPTDPVVVELVAIAPDAGEIDGTVTAYSWEWGTTVEIEVANLPERARYEIWVIDEHGNREPAGTWGPTEHRGARVRSASALPRDRLATVEVRDPAGELVLGADLP